MPTYLPGGNTLVTHSFEERLLTAEFDDALCDQAAWKNSRYDGSKLIAKNYNVFTPSSSAAGWAGDESYQNLPVISKHSTALYIANTVVGGNEDPQYATIKNHSYVGINKILLINPKDESVQVIDKATEPYQQFHRFITNDFGTGVECKIKVLDESISDNLQGRHKVKMNKGWLLKTFDYKFVKDNQGVLGGSGNSHGGLAQRAKSLIENNSMYLYRSGSLLNNYLVTGSYQYNIPSSSINNALRFRYGIVEMFPGASDGLGHKLTEQRVGPSFASSSIIENKFTTQYYTGSYGFIVHQPNQRTGSYHVIGTTNHLDPTSTNNMADFMNTTGLGSASKFLGIDSLKFLKDNNDNSRLLEQEKTEMHITFFEGTKDFAPGLNDERSISTFEVDQNIAALGLDQGGICNGYLPTNHELVFKGVNDGRFYPTTETFFDDFQNAHIMTDIGAMVTMSDNYTFNPPDSNGCVALDTNILPGGNWGGPSTGQKMQAGLTIDRYNDIHCYVQGGALGAIGNRGAITGSADPTTNFGQTSQLSNMHTNNFYSGSFNYQMSFLDKDHTLIVDLDKDAELFDGIGQKGVLVIPDNIDPQVAFNIEYYLNKAGIINDTSDTKQNISPNTTT